MSQVNYDTYVIYESEKVRLERLYKRFEKELEDIKNERITGKSKPTDWKD